MKKLLKLNCKLAVLSVLLGLFLNMNAFAEFNIVGSLATSLGNPYRPVSSISPIVGIEKTWGVSRIVGMGIYYDQMFLGTSVLGNLGMAVRVGLGSTSGWFVDGKLGPSAGFSSGELYFGYSLGADLGYHINETFSPKIGIRQIDGGGVVSQAIVDVGLIVTL